MSAAEIAVEIAGTPPVDLLVRASDLLDASNGFHFREWTQPDGQCYRWSGAAATVRLPLKIDRSQGNTVWVDLMRAFCDPPDFRFEVDGVEAPIEISDASSGIKLTARLPPSPNAVLVLEIASRTARETAAPDARRLGFAFVGARAIAGMQ